MRGARWTATCSVSLAPIRGRSGRRRGPRPLAPNQKTAALLDDFLAAQLAPRTRATYATDLAVFPDWPARCDVHPLAAARPELDRYRNWMSERVGADAKPARHGRPRYAPATVARRLSAVRSFYGYLVDRGAIDASPAVGVKAPRTEREPRGHAITEQQVASLIAAAEHHSDTAQAIVRLLVSNGLRVSEVCAARVERLEREPGGGLSLKVNGKGGTLASVGLNKRTARCRLQCREVTNISTRGSRRPGRSRVSRPMV